MNLKEEEKTFTWKKKNWKIIFYIKKEERKKEGPPFMKNEVDGANLDFFSVVINNFFNIAINL